MADTGTQIEIFLLTVKLPSTFCLIHQRRLNYTKDKFWGL